MAEIEIGNFERGCLSQPLEELVDLRQRATPWNGLSVVFFEYNGTDTGAKAKIRLVFHTQSRNSRGRWDRNRTCNLRFWRSRRYLPFCLVPRCDESQILRCVVFRIVPFWSAALLPFLLP
jgi:hypothetical protein